MKKIVFAIVLFFSLIFSVDAASISDIDMDISVDSLGNATVTETWQASVYEGTEGWHPYFNLGTSEITVKSASMDGKEYTVVSSWDEDASLDSKAYKAGIYSPAYNEVDIVFGISKYGSHTYQVVYEISNFVVSLNDSDMMYWTLFPKSFNVSPDNVSITITGEKAFADTVDVWGFGKSGAPCYVKDGKIEMTSDNEIVSSSEYLTILVKLDKGIFEPSTTIDKDFDYYLQLAKEGSVAYNGDGSDKGSSSSSYDFWETIITLFLTIFFPIIIVACSIIFSGKEDEYDFTTSGGKTFKDMLPFRDIPCNKDIYMAYFIAEKYHLGSSSNRKGNFLGAIILKWVKDGNVTIEKVTKDRLILADKIEDNIIFVKSPENANVNEVKLYTYLMDASKDGKLEANELKKWSKNHYNKLFNLFDDIMDYERDQLISSGHIVVQDMTTPTLKKKYKKYVIQKNLREEAEHLEGLRVFLKEFSQIDKREPIEVKLWNEYLIFAQILGMAKEVMEQFKKLYPEITDAMTKVGYDPATYIFINSISTESVSAASAARSAAQSYSGGGGGFSSGGGGGGSFGGGGGGGGFR